MRNLITWYKFAFAAWRNVKLNLSKDGNALQAGDDKIPLISKIILPSLHFYLVIVFAHSSGLQKFS